MPLHHRLAVHTALWCATLLTLTALAVVAQSVDVTSLCPGGDASRPVKLAPADKRTMRVLCDDEKGNCSVEVTVAMDEQAATTLCAPVNGVPNTITVDRAVAVQTEGSFNRRIFRCSPMLDDSILTHQEGDATFHNKAVENAWLDASGSISTVSICGDPDKDVLVCGSGDVTSAKSGESQLCGVVGIYQAVYTGMDRSGTNGCNGNGVRLYFTIVGVPEGREYSIYNLSFEAPVVTSVVILNGTQHTVTANASPGVPVSVRVDVVNPLEGHLISFLPRAQPVIGTSRMQPGSCTGYCAFQRNPQVAGIWLPMSATCTGATPNCEGGVTASSCAADVQLFESSTDDVELPYSTPDDSVRYELDEENRVVVDLSGSVVPLQGVFVFNQTVADRVTAKGAARDLSRATTQVLRQDAQHKDVVVVRAGGEVATASSACAFALRGVRGTDRMYSVTNVVGGPTCDLVIGNGVEQQTFTLATPAKASGAREVDDYETLWGEVDTVDEGGESNLPLILGLSLGLGVGLLAVIAAIVVGVVCCRRKKACCFADDGAKKDGETGCCACAALCCCCCDDSPEDGGDAGDDTTKNPLQKSRSPAASPAPKRLGTASTMQGDCKTDMSKQSDLYSSASELTLEPAHANDCPSPEKTRVNTQSAAPVTHKAANGQRSAPHPPARPSATPTSSPIAKPAQPIRAAQTPPETPLLGPSIASLRALSPPLAKPAAPPTTNRTTPPTQPTVTTEAPPLAPLKREATTASLRAPPRPVTSPIAVPTTDSNAQSKTDVHARGSIRGRRFWRIEEDEMYTSMLLKSSTDARIAIPAMDSNLDRCDVCAVDRVASFNTSEQRMLSQRELPAPPVSPSAPTPVGSNHTSRTEPSSDAQLPSPRQEADSGSDRSRLGGEGVPVGGRANDDPRVVDPDACGEGTGDTLHIPVDDGLEYEDSYDDVDVELWMRETESPMNDGSNLSPKHSMLEDGRRLSSFQRAVLGLGLGNMYMGDPSEERDNTIILDRKSLLKPVADSYGLHTGRSHELEPDTLVTFRDRYRPPEHPFELDEQAELLLSIDYPKDFALDEPLMGFGRLTGHLQHFFNRVLQLPLTEVTFAILYCLATQYAEAKAWVENYYKK